MLLGIFLWYGPKKLKLLSLQHSYKQIWRKAINSTDKKKKKKTGFNERAREREREIYRHVSITTEEGPKNL